jgi:MFS family permease
VPGPHPDGASRRWLGLAVVLTGQFMASLDTTIGNIAAPAISSDLVVGAGTAALAVAAYTLIYASTLITGARLGADRGRRQLFLIGIAIFTAASTLAGVAPDAAVLVAARAIQGLGAALAIPQAISFIQADFVGRARARALTVYGVTISIGAGAGLAAGGALIALDLGGLGWRVVFLINLPIGIVVLAAATRTLPRVVPTTRLPLDVLGVVLLTMGAALVAGPLALAANVGLPVLSWICMAAGSALLAAFWSWQNRQRVPLLDPAILATPGVRPGLAVLLLTGTTYTGTLYCVATELQQHQHWSPVRAGLALLSFVAGYSVGSCGGAIVPLRYHGVLIVAGIGCLAGSLIVLGALARTGWPAGAPVLLVGAGLGYGACFNPTLGRALANVKPTLISDASGIATTTFQFSFVVGVAVFGSIYTTSSIAWALVGMGAFAALAIAATLSAPSWAG